MLRAPKTTHNFLKVDGRYVCADNLRFACALSIVAVHSAIVLTMTPAASPAVELFQFAAVTIAKFGTICFFLISGFLLEKNLQTRSPLELLQRRLSKVFLPWMFWFVLTSVVLSVVQFLRHTGTFQPDRPLYVSIWMTSVHTFTTTAFWFVPNLLVALLVLLIFRRYLQSLVFGGTLFAATLFYSLNVYGEWIEPHHARALFGFVFYLWLGHYAGVNLNRFSRLLQSIPAAFLWLATLLAAVASFGEGRLLVHLHAVDPLNTLKVTTQVFSVLVFLCFFKHQRRIWPAFLDVSRTTFGMYLVHVVTFVAFACLIRIFVNRPGPHPWLGTFGIRLAMWLAAAALTVLTSYILSRALSASRRLSWSVGSPRRVATVQACKTEAIEAAAVA